MRTRKKIPFTIEKTNTGYSAFGYYKKDILLSTTGADYTELKANILDVTNLALEEENRSITLDDIELTIDLAQFFDFYKELNAKGIAERAGINHTLLSQYVSGKKKPSPKQVSRILEGIRSLGREMAGLDLVG